MSGLTPVTLSANGNSVPINIIFSPVLVAGLLQIQFALGLIVTFSAGANLNATIQVTADPTPSATGNWNNHDTLFNLNGSANGNVAYPITGIRLVVTNWVAGSVTLGIAKWP